MVVHINYTSICSLGPAVILEIVQAASYTYLMKYDNYMNNSIATLPSVYQHSGVSVVTQNDLTLHCL